MTVTAAPALHGPPGAERLVGPVIGFLLEAPGEPTVYVSGDNASLELVQQIADRFPAVDVAILFAGAARVPSIDAALTLTAADAAKAAGILGAHRVVGLHTEDWEHFSESRAQLEAAFAGTGLLVDTPRGVKVELQSVPRVELAETSN
jgi:L-ascorbate metabolism protein UlaG (beta-lactamase superfamily)